MDIDLISLFNSFGWQLLIIGFIDAVIIGIIKTVINKKLQKSTGDVDYTTSGNLKYDKIITLVSLGIAIILGCIYTLCADKFGWIYDVAEDGTRIYSDIGVLNYLSNICSVWLYSSVLFTIWKKLGLKGFFTIIYNAFKKVVYKKVDINQDNQITLDELATLISGMLADKKLTVSDILNIISDVVPEAANDIITAVTEEAGEDGVINTDDLVGDIADLAQTVADKIPVYSVSEVASAVVEKAEEIAGDAVEEVISSAATSDSNTLETATVAKPQRPKVQF